MFDPLPLSGAEVLVAAVGTGSFTRMAKAARRLVAAASVAPGLTCDAA